MYLREIKYPEVSRREESREDRKRSRLNMASSLDMTRAREAGEQD